MEPLESIAVSAAQGALNIVLAKAVDEIKLTWEFKDDLDNLKDRLKTLQAFLVDAGTKKSLNILEKLWIEKVEKVATRAKGLFDEFSSENGRRQVEVEIEDRYYHKGSLLNARYMFFLCLSNPLGFRWRIAHQVKGVNSMINDVFKEAHELGIRARDLAPAISDYQYKEVVDTRQVVGRDRDEAYLVEQLCRAGSTSTGDVSFVAIVGIPGSLLSSTLSHFIA